jgi:CDP-2,3-bis-(O-geranylgeranyl)-sn-glycerol synthase
MTTTSIIGYMWFFLPAGIANMAPIFAKQLPGLRHWNTPIDFGASVNGHRVLGNNKTWRGIVCGTIVAVIAGFLQQQFVISDYTPSLVAAGLLGFGALFGDALKSFFKRQLGHSDGDSWFPFDQTDYIIGGLLCVSLVVDVTLEQVLAILISYFVFHIFISYIGYKLKLKDRPI